MTKKVAVPGRWQNLFTFHGTSAETAAKILNNGARPQDPRDMNRGLFGGGIYSALMPYKTDEYVRGTLKHLNESLALQGDVRKKKLWHEFTESQRF